MSHPIPSSPEHSMVLKKKNNKKTVFRNYFLCKYLYTHVKSWILLDVHIIEIILHFEKFRNVSRKTNRGISGHRIKRVPVLKAPKNTNLQFYTIRYSHKAYLDSNPDLWSEFSCVYVIINIYNQIISFLWNMCVSFTICC